MSRSELPAASEYYVGWLCALQVPERIAAIAMLDKKYEYEACGLDPPVDTGRSGNIYTYGRMGRRNVVIACLDKGGTGNMNSAQMLGPLMEYFKNMNIFILVGIAGGIPGPRGFIDKKNTLKNIHLGDVVISSRRKSSPGVESWTEVEVKTKGNPNVAALDKAHHALQQAAGLLEAELASPNGHKILTPYWERLKNWESLRRPELEDVLYQADYEHADEDDTCSSCDETRRVVRPQRKSGALPVIHYGMVLSGNLMKSGVRRDELAREHPTALCFEMEAAGLDNSHCLTVRGISDYADSHKNKEWQGFAAASAAVVAKHIIELAQFHVPEMPKPNSKIRLRGT